MVSSHYEHPRLARDSREEVMLRVELRDKLVRRVHGGIDVSPDPLLRHSQCVDDILKRCIPNDEKIDIAHRRVWY
jgi:hypothetical protein